MTNRLTVASRKLISFLAIIAMVITSISFISVQNNVYAATDTAQVGDYTISVPSGASLNGASASTEVTKLDTSGSYILTGGWYVFDGHVIISKGLTIEGDCNIILADGCDAHVSGKDGNAGIQVSNGASLTIWSSSQNTGNIFVYGGDGGAGIGGGSNSDCSNITINGGNIVARGGNGGAGIGGGSYSDGSNIIINDGNIVARGGDGGAGIGGGNGGNGSNITIKGGSVTANGYDGGAGIGGGNGGAGHDITINDCSVTAQGHDRGAGIGGGNDGAGHKITINGGSVNAQGSNAAGIGGGNGGYGYEITINGGSVNARGYNAAGIGGGNGGYGYLITINGGSITAQGGFHCAGIGGGGLYCAAGNIIINKSMIVKGGSNESRLTVIDNDGSDLSNKIADRKSPMSYVSVEEGAGGSSDNPDWNNSTTPESTSIKSLKSYKKSVKVTWATKTDVDGYQILYKTTKSPTKNYKKVTVKSATTATKTIKNLKRNKRYYFKIRTYAGTTSNHSAWSKLKSVKTK